MTTLFDVPVTSYDLIVLAQDSFASLLRVTVGVVLASVAGVTLGLLRSRLPHYVKRNFFANALMDMWSFPPPIAWIPFIILVAGIGEAAAYAIVFIGAFSPIFSNTYDGAERIPLAVSRTAASLEITGFRYVWLIMFPCTLPQILTGVRTGVRMGWMSVIAAEMVSGQSGLGYAIEQYGLNLQYHLVLLNFIAIGLFGFLLSDLTWYLEKKLTPWSETH